MLQRLLFLVLCFAMQGCGADDAGTNSSNTTTYCNGNFCLSWVLLPNTITLTMSMSAGGYVAIGFTDVAGNMGPADAYVGWIDPLGNARVLDTSTTDSHTINPPDAQQDCQNISGSVDNGTLTITFTRALNTNDINDRVIGADDLSLIWCWADIAPSATAIGWVVPTHDDSAVGSSQLNFVTGASAADDGGNVDQLLWIPVTALMAFVGVILLPGLFNRLCPNAGISHGLRRVLQRHLFAPRSSNWKHKYSLDTVLAFCDLSVGEMLMCSLWLVTFLIMLISPGGDPLGRVCAIGMGTVMLPVTKRSIWLALLGCSFERAIRFHRWVARCLMVVLTAHLIMQCIAQGYAVFSAVQDDLGYGWVFGFASYVILVVVVLLALEPIRRRWYEAFYYPHFLSLAAVALAMVHSVAVCYVMAPALFLYLLDKALVLIECCRQHRITTVTQLGEVVRIDVECVSGSKPFAFSPGQFYFVNVPAISYFQYHPFTAACLPEQGQLSFVIRNMGPGTFTEKLYRLDGPAKVNLSGPYGSLTVPDVRSHSVVYLIAGGVGVTPIISIAQSLLEVACPERKVHFIWVSRTPQAFQDWFPGVIPRMADAPGFFVRLFCDVPANSRTSFHVKRAEDTPEQTRGDASKGTMPFVTFARPDWGAIFEAHHGDGSNVAVLVCGPPPMMTGVQAHSQKNGFEFHKETFGL